MGSRVSGIDESTPTDQFIAWTIERFRNRRVVITTSFGMEGCALIDMFAAQGAAPTVVYLDTMFFFPETYALGPSSGVGTRTCAATFGKWSR